jgi:hypothetical protein
MVMMAVLSITMFVGIRCWRTRITSFKRAGTVVSQIARGVFGGRGWPYYAVQGRDDVDPGAGSKYGVRRLSEAGVDSGARSISPAATDESG